jgi:4-amino-4-deoxy-L-arabinose transferase-like glycosyltransferase
MRKIIKPYIILLLLILLVAFFARTYKLNNPIADHHSWRQADTAAVARNFVMEDFNLLKPRIDNMATQSGPKLPINEQRYFFTEFPIYNAVVAGVYGVFGVDDRYARLVTIFASLGTIVFLFLLLRRIFGKTEALIGALFYAVMPYAVYFGRVALPEPTMVLFTVASVYLLFRWRDTHRNTDLLVSAILFSLALVVKIYAIFVFPAFLYLLFVNRRKLMSNPWVLAAFFAIAFMPILLWRFYIGQTPEGIPGYEWLFNQGNIRFTGAFFRWIIFERFDKLMLTVGGFALLALGLMLKTERRAGWFFHIWFIGLLLYTVVIATGNVTHDYYQIIFLPILVIFVAKAAGFLLKGGANVTSYVASVAIVGFALLTTVALGWYEVRGFYNIQSGVDLAGAYINENTPTDSLVITGIVADTTLLYNTNRHGWTIGYGTPYDGDPKSVELLREKGADYYVTTRVSDLFANNNLLGNYLKNNYYQEKLTDQYAVFDLNRSAQ